MPTRNGDTDGDLVCHQAQVWSFGSASFPFDTGLHSVRVGISLHSQESRDLPHGGCLLNWDWKDLEIISSCSVLDQTLNFLKSQLQHL